MKKSHFINVIIRKNLKCSHDIKYLQHKHVLEVDVKVSINIIKQKQQLQI